MPLADRYIYQHMDRGPTVKKLAPPPRGGGGCARGGCLAPPAVTGPGGFAGRSDALCSWGRESRV
eukprot:scaffold282718_cov18-Tisochrysis_lutea.AAC.1